LHTTLVDDRWSIDRASSYCRSSLTSFLVQVIKFATPG
jgi:hypothetical protein